ncbi:MAG: PEGA domain-containing protein [Phycisphaerales bacterium]|nr:MAG: PEGA domain-containing protein [Phycisphaerales bacterium]
MVAGRAARANIYTREEDMIEGISFQVSCDTKRRTRRRRLALFGGGLIAVAVAGCVSRSVVIRSDPPEATVFLDGAQEGRTPLTRKLTWDSNTTHTVTVTADQYERQTRQLPYREARGADSPWGIDFSLARLAHTVAVRVRSNVTGADVRVDDKLVGRTPLTHNFVFTRSDEDSPWTSYSVSVSKEGFRWRREAASARPGDTGQFTRTLSYEQARSGDLYVELEPIRYVWTKLRYYNFEGDAIGIGEERVLAQVGEVETEPMVQSVTRMTDRPPGELIDTRLWVAPPEQELVYSVPFTRAAVEGELSNLWRQVGQGLTRLTDGPVLDIHACVSADGQFAYFASNRLRPDKVNLWRVRMTGQGGFTKITDSPSSEYDLEPAISPDGSRLAYASRLRDAKSWQIWVANTDGTLPTQLRTGQSPAWAPDSRQLAYVSIDDEGFKQVWIMNADGSRPTQLTSGKAQHEYPIWTPDGKRIVYASNEAINAEGLANYDIWIMNVDGTDRTQLTVNGSWDNRPAISSDGKYIYFLSNRGAKKEDENNWQVWRMELK